MLYIQILYLSIIIPPLLSSIINGLFGFYINRTVAHSIAILGVLIASVASIVLFYLVHTQNLHFDSALYTWLTINNHAFNIGILIDKLSTIMLVVVTFVSLMVHIYTIAYMEHEDGYIRFFSYISLFTFMMIMLVLSNNFVQLFFAWEGVGLVSYLLIGFYIKKDSAVFANLKAFLVNRIGDFGFLLGIGVILYYTGSLNYSDLFSSLTKLMPLKFYNTSYDLITVICLLLFVGAMGKSAQFPLHVWLPDSMEGPTPISALIHAATMVTAGIFMVSRLSPLYNLSPTALSFMLIIGSINCLFMGLLGLIQYDIKKVVAYSTLSQLGYMVVALGTGSYSIAIFHLMTHAFFKGLLFLCAGSVIVAMHHQQDMRYMGGLKNKMPITYITMLIGSLALAGIPPFAGFFSKDMILETVALVHDQGMFGSSFALFACYISVFITALYSFRLMFMTFHGEARYLKYVDNHEHHVHETPLVITGPLILMAIPSVLIAYFSFKYFVDGSIVSGAVFNASWYQNIINHITEHNITANMMILDSLHQLPVYLALSGILAAYLLHKYDKIPTILINKYKIIYTVMLNNYYMDYLYINILLPIFRGIGKFLWVVCDNLLIDKLVVNGVAKLVGVYSNILKRVQTGYLNNYATLMVFGVIVLLSFFTKLILV